MKKKIYILAFTVFGLLAQFLLHAIIEVAYINLLEVDWLKYSLGLTWSQLILAHNIMAIVLSILGLIFGYIQGKYWWQILYVEKKIKKGLKENFSK